MQFNKVVGILVFLVFILSGCTKYTMTSYDNVEATNYVIITQFSNEMITGTVTDVKPHQIIILENGGFKRAVTRSSIKSVKLKQPVYDEFSRGISEPEIVSNQTKSNTVIYGIGGGIISCGVSFFIGSLLGESGSTVALTTGVGGVLGMYLFFHAGAKKDRRDAIAKICQERKSELMRKDQGFEDNKNTDIWENTGDKEEMKKEELEKRREELLKKLKEVEKEKKKKKKLQ